MIEVPADRRAGFLAIRTPRAAEFVGALRAQRVFVDSRGDILRLGPAPYLSDNQLTAGIAILSRVIT
jgi:kynureninase